MKNSFFDKIFFKELASAFFVILLIIITFLCFLKGIISFYNYTCKYKIQNIQNWDGPVLLPGPSLFFIFQDRPYFIFLLKIKKHRG